MRLALVMVGLLVLASCGVDGEPVRPTASASVDGGVEPALRVSDLTGEIYSGVVL